MIERRRFVGDIAASIFALPLVARGQQPGKVYRIGILEAIPAEQNAANLDALRRGWGSAAMSKGGT